MTHPLEFVNDGDAARVREIVRKLDEIRGTPNGAMSTDYAYWQGYLTCYCEQNAIPDDALSFLWGSAGVAAMREP